MRQDKTPLPIPSVWVMDGERDCEGGIDEEETEWLSCGNADHNR